MINKYRMKKIEEGQKGHIGESRQQERFKAAATVTDVSKDNIK